MKQVLLGAAILLLAVSFSQCKLDYDSAKYVIQYEEKLEKCIKDIGFFSCSTLGKMQEVQQNCLNAIRTYEKCIQSTCFDAEYIEFKQGVTFNYLTSYYQYATDKSGECERDPIVIKYANKSQSTKNYIQEKQDCFDKSVIVYNPNLPLTNINETLDYCINEHPKCDSACKDKVSAFNSCIWSEEKKFTVVKSFWDLSSTLQDFKKQIYSKCANSMKPQIDLSPQFTHYVHCVQKQLESSSAGKLNLNLLLIALSVFIMVFLI